MTDLSDIVNNAPIPLREVPAEFRHASQVWDGQRGEVRTGVLRGEQDREDLIKMAGHDPSKVRIVGKVGQWVKEQADGEPLVSYYFQVESSEIGFDLPALYQELRRSKSTARPKAITTGRITVPVISDLQVGKVDSRGGTKELLIRLEETRGALEALLKTQKPEKIVLMDAGDSVESFENTGAQAFTNDLSFPDQVDIAAVECLKFLQLCQKFAPTQVMAIPSNHGAWRNGKQVLGKPGDDWGLHIWKRIARETGVELFIPDEWSEAVTYDANGTILGLTHGHQVSRPEQVPLWWAKQTHGGQSIGQADILVTGHFHHFRALPTGRNPYTQRSKWWFQAPTLDNGSSWWRNHGGEDSDPGMLVLGLSSDGLESHTVL